MDADARALVQRQWQAHARAHRVIALPVDFVDWVVTACEAGLPNPVARALYVCNRKKHTWPTLREVLSKEDERAQRWSHRAATPLDVMKRTRPETAEKWLTHWLAGGCYYSPLTDAQVRNIERQNRDKQLSDGDRLRRWIRRARRADFVVTDDHETQDQESTS